MTVISKLPSSPANRLSEDPFGDTDKFDDHADLILFGQMKPEGK